MCERVSSDFLMLFCEKNSDGTKHLRLKGKDLFQRKGFRLNHMDMYKVSLFLLEHPEIIGVDLCYNDFADLGMEIFSENYFATKNNLLHLNLMSCDITYVGLSKLYKNYANLKLKTLRLNGNKFGKTGGEYIAKFLENIPSLELVEIGDTDQIINSIDSILAQARSSNIKVLDISRIIPKHASDILNTEWIALNVGLFLEVNTKLTELHLEKCELDGHDVEKMLYGLWANKTLKLLDISSNKIGCFGLEIIAKWLETKPPLIGLDVSANMIKNIGARSLSFGMTYSRLRFLNIANNKIDDDGLACIFDTLKKPYMLRLFFFFGNPFGQKTMQILNRMLISTVLVQEFIDTKLFKIDGEFKAAYYPANHFKQQYYSVMDYACPVELKIKRNKIVKENSKRQSFYSTYNYERYPPIDFSKMSHKKESTKKCL